MKYICTICRKEFESSWSDEEAVDELSQTFPGYSKEDCAVVCEDCYKKMGFGDDD